MRRAALSLTVSALLLTPVAMADLTLWEQAKAPGWKTRAKARLTAEQLFEQASDPQADLETLRELSLGSAALLELSGGAKTDPWQQVLLGRVLLDAQQGREREGLQLIESALPALPDSDFKRASLFDVGVASMRIGEMDHAAKVFTAALQLAWDPDDRASIHRIRGRAYMLSGRTVEAIADYRAAVRLARTVVGIALSHFGLGGALERGGDYPQGMQEIARGVAIRLPVPPYATESVLDAPTLFWIPEYDVHYFRALGAMTEAEAADSSELAKERYESALENWEQYIPAAEAQKSRFLPNALRHRQRVEDALGRLKRGPQGAAPRSGRVR